KLRGDLSKSDRYDTEVAFADQAVGDLLAVLGELYPPDRTLIVFAADHGENLGEHGYWGHGRHLWEENLHVPTSITWPEHLRPTVVGELASNLDLAPTVLGLIGLPAPETFRGFDWTPVLEGREQAPTGRITEHQAHRGAVHGTGDEDRVRRRGLLEVGIVQGTTKEVLRLKGADTLSVFDLAQDPGEKSAAKAGGEVPKHLGGWLAEVNAGLTAADNLPAPALDEESLEQLRALGYID
ncbi:MAG: sulfatase-like hydrolase/transferase, partial [Acidobacteria bacterium]|nr:sulfatase-like hydrolase/transferase [Acidobacteriota bacterium]